MCWIFLSFEDSQNNKLLSLNAWTEESETFEEIAAVLIKLSFLN